MGLALETAQRYDDAIASLKLFMATKPQEEVLRKTQDEIYRIEAKAQKVAKQAENRAREKTEQEASERKQRDEQRAAELVAAEQQRQREAATKTSFAGDWKWAWMKKTSSSGLWFIRITRAGDEYTLEHCNERSGITRTANVRFVGRRLQFDLIADNGTSHLSFTLSVPYRSSAAQQPGPGFPSHAPSVWIVILFGPPLSAMPITLCFPCWSVKEFRIGPR